MQTTATYVVGVPLKAMSLLSHDLAQSWSTSSEQVLTDPENSF